MLPLRRSARYDHRGSCRYHHRWCYERGGCGSGSWFRCFWFRYERSFYVFGRQTSQHATDFRAIPLTETLQCQNVGVETIHGIGARTQGLEHHFDGVHRWVSFRKGSRCIRQRRRMVQPMVEPIVPRSEPPSRRAEAIAKPKFSTPKPPSVWKLALLLRW